MSVSISPLAGLGVAYYLIVGFGGWHFVRGHGQSWRFILWLTLLFGPMGLIVAVLARSGARRGEQMAGQARDE